MTQGSFDYNASRIPGLGIVGTSTESGPYYSPSAANWTQTPSPNVGGVPAQHHDPVDSFNAAPSQVSHTREQWPLAGSSGPLRLDEQPQSSNMGVEEGELSEGQFEDLYASKDASHDARASDNGAEQISDAARSCGASLADTPDAGFYGNDERDAEAAEAAPRPPSNAGQQRTSSLDILKLTSSGRERSGSYSPYLSPREIQDEAIGPSRDSNVITGNLGPMMDAIQSSESSL